MRKYKKQIIIILCVLVGIIVTAVTFCLTLFTVKDIRIDFRTSTEYSYSNDEIIEKSELPYGKCVFFLKKAQYIENIEKKFPYLEVLNIETIIPCHLVLHLSERQEFYAIKHKDKLLYCDDEFKVLKIEDWTSYESTSTNPIFIDENKISIQNKSIEAGDFLKIKENEVLDLYNAMLKNSRNRAEMLASFKQIETFVAKEEVTDEKQVGMKLVLHSGREIFIYNISYGLEYKLQKTFALLSEIMNIEKFEYDGTEYNKDDAVIREEMINILSNAQIHVKNYISKENFTEKDNYYYLTYGEKRLGKI